MYGNLSFYGCNNNVPLETDKFGEFELETWIRLHKKLKLKKKKDASKYQINDLKAGARAFGSETGFAFTGGGRAKKEDFV